MKIIGWVLFIFGYLLFWAANLQKTNFVDVVPSYVLMICGAGLLVWREWKDNKNKKKEISVFAVGSYLGGLIAFIPHAGLLIPIASIVSVILGIFFIRRNKKEEGRLVGNCLSVMGFILGGTLLVFMLLMTVFPTSQR